MFAGRRAAIPGEILPLPSGPDRAISAAMSERVVVLHTDLPNRYLYFYTVIFVFVFVFVFALIFVFVFVFVFV